MTTASRICALALVVACSAPTHPTARYYAFRSKWPIDVDKAWDATIAVVAALHRTAVVDREHGVIMTVAEPLDVRDPSLTVQYVVELQNRYGSFRRASTDIPVGLNVIVGPLAMKNGQVLPAEQVPQAALDHRDQLISSVKEGVWRSGAVH